MDEKQFRKNKLRKCKPDRPSTAKLRKNCSERIVRLALPSMHIVAAVLRDHFKKLSRDQVGRLEKLIKQIQEFHNKSCADDLMKTFNDFAQSEKDKIMEIIQNVENKKQNITLEGIDFNEIKMLPLKSASDTYLIDLDKKLNFLYSIEDRKKFQCLSNDDFLNSQSDISSFNIFKLASSLQKSEQIQKKKDGRTHLSDKELKNIKNEKENIKYHFQNLPKPNIKTDTKTDKKSTVSVSTQCSTPTNVPCTIANKTKTELLRDTSKDDEKAAEMKILFRKHLTEKRIYPKQKSITTQSSFHSYHKPDLDHVHGDFAGIGQEGRIKPVTVRYHYFYKQLMRILQNIYDVIRYELLEALSKCIKQVQDLDNYVYYIHLPYNSYLKYKPILSSAVNNMKMITNNPKNLEFATYMDYINQFCSNIINFLLPRVVYQPFVTIMECFYNFMFLYDDSECIELNSDNIKTLRAIYRRKRRKYIYNLHLQNLCSVLQ